MTRETVHSRCPHRFLMVKGFEPTRSVETFRCNECGTSRIRPTVPLHLVPVPAKGMTSDTVTRSQGTSTRKSEIVFGLVFPPLP